MGLRIIYYEKIMVKFAFLISKGSVAVFLQILIGTVFLRISFCLLNYIGLDAWKKQY